MKKRYPEEQITGLLRESDAGISVKNLSRRHGFTEVRNNLLRGKHGEMNITDAKPGAATGAVKACCFSCRRVRPAGPGSRISGYQ